MKVQILRPNHCILLQSVLIVQLGLDRLWVEQPSYHAMASRRLVAKIVAKISLSWPIWFRNCIEFLQLFQISLAQVDCELVGLDLWLAEVGLRLAGCTEGLATLICVLSGSVLSLPGWARSSPIWLPLLPGWSGGGVDSSAYFVFRPYLTHFEPVHDSVYKSQE